MATAKTTKMEPALWNLVFFKVEDSLFSVPQHRFTENSEVFEGMFRMPQGTDSHSVEEGIDKEHPIVLEGYQAADFRALVKVLYPAPRDLISGTFKLEKEEWTGVLNLSTRWQMKEIRDHAIENLSKMALRPVEKVTLARAHKVARWLKEGITELIEEMPIRPLDEIQSLGIDTACRILWIRDQAPRNIAGQEVNIKLSSLACPNGHGVFTSPRNCYGCGREISVDDSEAIYVYQSSTSTYSYSNGKIELHMNLNNLRCQHCSNYPIYPSTHSCPTCNTQINPSRFTLLITGSRQRPQADSNVDDIFKEEIASYESWDQ